MRLEWLHATATRDRWWEEHVLLFHELRRVGRTFRYEERCWTEKAGWNGWPDRKATPELIAGVRAHAKKMAAMYQDLAEEAERRFRIVQEGRPLTETVPSDE